MADYENILYEKQRKGVLNTMNRPEQMNALSAGLRSDMHAAFDEAQLDETQQPAAGFEPPPLWSMSDAIVRLLFYIAVDFSIQFLGIAIDKKNNSAELEMIVAGAK